MNPNATPGNSSRLDLAEMYLYKKARLDAEQLPPTNVSTLVLGVAIWMGVIGVLWLIG
ncbi:MAG: hypothetical protein OEW11_04290 [Nitrospirota bacterium]|nr:hypothetical protein [Nitrospirota bacterium]